MRSLCDYRGQISGELFAEEEQRLDVQVEAVKSEAANDLQDEVETSEVSVRFEAVAAALRDLDIDTIWREAEDDERRVLVEEMVEEVAIFPDHLEVKVAGAPRINVRLDEVG